MKAFLLVGMLFLWLVPPTAVLALDAVEAEKVEALLRLVSTMKEEKFIRNGVAYDAAKAVRLIRYKYDKEKARLTDAGDFIEKCAAKSSTTGKPYQIKFPDGTVKDSADFLREKLKEMESTNTPPAS